MSHRDWPMHDLFNAVENARDWLRDAVRIACEDEIPEGEWPELDAYVRRIDEVLKAAESLLPLPPELDATYRWERDEMDDGADRAEALRG